MARLRLNKSSLAQETAGLQAYKRFLPSLDMKRRQLMVERARAERTLAQTTQAIDEIVRDLGARAPMLADQEIVLGDLVTVEDIVHGEENVVGVKLPTLERVQTHVLPYSRLAKPHWVDLVARKLHDALVLYVRKDVEARRLQLLREAVKTVTQRVNLFEKVLIPRALANIRRIKIALTEEQVSAVVRSKIAKRKRAQQVSAQGQG